MREQALDRLAAWDRALCRRFNGATHFTGVRLTLVVASRLGNGIFWYALMASLLVFGGATAIPAVLHMIVVGLVCTALYKAIKRGTSRARPYAGEPRITLCAAPLDQYSFPSGHTLHATAFAWVALGAFLRVLPIRGGNGQTLGFDR
ncbi:MAG: phosphoesterase [Betaproteobacteria bacterium]|nr:phosphoesterase [Betaproteobacteria bacterium]